MDDEPATMAMTPATFRTHLEQLGLTAEWFAERVGVTKVRVWKYCSKRRVLPVPDHAARAIRQLLVEREAAVADARWTVQADGQVPRFRQVGDWWDQVPQLAGWPEAAQGPYVAEVMARYQVEAVWA